MSKDVRESLYYQIKELTKYTVALTRCTKPSFDADVSSSLDLSLRKFINIDFYFVSRFVALLYFGRESVWRNPKGGLLQLWTHEWQRFILDPLPEGIVLTQY